MKTPAPIGRVVMVILAAIAVMMIATGQQPRWSVGETPITPPPVVSTPHATPAPSGTDEAASTAASFETAAVESTLTKQPSSRPAPRAFHDIQSIPVHIAIKQGQALVAGAGIVGIQLDGEGNLNPPKGSVGWYGPSQWPVVPGNESLHPAILAGHVSYDGAPDVFADLKKVQKGDTVILTYDDGQTATFRVDADAISAPKDDVTAKSETDYAWIWNLEKPGRKLSIFTCDPSLGRDGSGHSFNNWVIQATRIN